MIGFILFVRNKFIMQVESKNHPDDHYLVYHDKTLKCVCELCTCGKHRCPRPRIKGNFQTSYSMEFQKPPQVAPPSPYKQYKYEQRHYSPDVLKSNYQETYHQIPIKQQTPTPNSPNRFQNVGSKMVFHHVPFTGSSSYKDQYKPFQIQPIQQNPEQGPMARGQVPGYTYHKAPQVRFEGISSYKASFVEPPKPENKMTQSMAPTGKPVHVPFYGDSSYKNDYPAYKIQTRKEENLDLQRIKVAPVRFEGSSSYKDQFQGYRVEVPQSSQHQRCIVDHLHVPPVNYINEKQHIYYDPDSKKFI